MLGHLARSLSWEDHRASLLVLFAELTTPIAVVSANLMGEDPSIGVTTRGDSYSIQEIWERHIEPHLAEIREWLFGVITSQIEMADMLLEAAGEETRDFDFLTFRVPEL